LCGTYSYQLFYQGRPILGRVLDIHGFLDVYWAGYMDHKKDIQVGMYLTHLEEKSIG
jgi:hypothetical protein